MHILYIANKNYSSWSLRPWVLMHALEIPFEERIKPFKPGSNWDAFRSFSPSGTVPALLTPQGAIWDSLAITEFLAEQYKSVWPADQVTRAWARCAAAEMHSGFSALRDVCSMSCGLRIKLREINPALRKDITRIDELWCEGLERFGGPFLGGDKFSAVDAFFAPVVFRVQTYGLDMSSKANAYVQHMLELPAMQRWYREALQETWRDVPHDEMCLQFGDITEDFRAT